MKPANRLTANMMIAMTKRTCAMPVAVEAIPPKPKIAATSATTRNINAQYNMAVSSESGCVQRLHNAALYGRLPGNSARHVIVRGAPGRPDAGEKAGTGGNRGVRTAFS